MLQGPVSMHIRVESIRVVLLFNTFKYMPNKSSRQSTDFWKSFFHDHRKYREKISISRSLSLQLTQKSSYRPKKPHLVKNAVKSQRNIEV
jgi:hypothetical protein